MRHRRLNYNEAKSIFKKGVALEKQGWGKDKSIPANIAVSKLKAMSAIAYQGAERTKQMQGLGGLGQADFVGTVNNLVSSVPDSIGGISTKAILLGALLVTLLKR